MGNVGYDDWQNAWHQNRKNTLMTKTDNTADWNSTTGRPKPKPSPAHEVDPRHTGVKHDELLGRVGIAPAKPVWPSKK